MNVLLIGGSGTIGRKVIEALSAEHDVIVATRTSGDVRVDIADARSITRMYEKVSGIEAVICTAGEAVWNDFGKMDETDFYVGIRSKLMGQVNLVRIGKDFLPPSGSITLTTGILADKPVPRTTSAAMVNGALHSFVKAVALDLPDGPRVNAVCSDLVMDSAERYHNFFPGHIPVPMDAVVDAYVTCLTGTQSGSVVWVTSRLPSSNRSMSLADSIF